MTSQQFKRSDLVETWFDTGAMGAAILYGVVIASGPKAARVRWESGLTNRIAQDCHNVKPAQDQGEARKACGAAT
jgi:hypothetical protein